MRRALRLAVIALLAPLVAAAGPATSPVDVREPQGLYEGAPQGYVPATLAGASVADLDEIERLVAGKAVLIDVSEAPRKPAGLPSNTLWLPTHRTIPGAHWLPDAGAAPLTRAREDAFLARIAALTEGDASRPIVTFCAPECWGGWNAGKRLVLAGYQAVHWYPDGVPGWQDAHETTVVKPDQAWIDAATGTERPLHGASRSGVAR